MEMTSLRELHLSMRGQSLEIQQFWVRTGATEFDCLFSVRDEPYCLALTSRGASPKFFRFDVKKGYWIDDYMGAQYLELREVLFIDGRSNQKLIPKNFLEQLNQIIPRAASNRSVPTSVDIMRIRNDIEDPDRPYFDRWEQRGKGPTQQNLKKTLLILGREAYNHSISVNKSSIWSAEPTHRSWR
jgi:hypothetical protein